MRRPHHRVLDFLLHTPGSFRADEIAGHTGVGLGQVRPACADLFRWGLIERHKVKSPKTEKHRSYAWSVER